MSQAGRPHAAGSAPRDGGSTAAVHRVSPVPSEMRELCSLERVDYSDAFHVSGLAGDAWSAEPWARHVLEDAPTLVRAQLVAGWWAIGLKIWPRDARRILGWQVRTADDGHVVLGAPSGIGLPAELVFARAGSDWRFGTFLTFHTPVARATWVLMEGAHVRVVPGLLARASAGPRPGP